MLFKRESQVTPKFFFSWLYSLVHMNRIKVKGSGNVIHKSNSYLNRCKIFINGNNNRVDFFDGANYFSECTINITGDNNQLLIGERNVIINGSFIMEDSNNSIILGDRNRIMGATEFAALEGTKISIGNECLFSSNIYFRTSDSHPIFEKTTLKRINPAKSITVGDSNWFGARTTILKGVSVADNCVIGVGSILTKNVSNNCIVAGVPAVVVKENICWTIRRNI